MKSKLKYALICMILVAGCGTDQLSKHVAKEALKGSRPLILCRGFIDLCYAENTGMAFSLLDGLSPDARTQLLTYVPLIIAVGFAGLLYRSRGKPLAALLPLVLILAGASGNLLDRLRCGYVVDFVHFHIRDRFHWPIFNLADALIFLGALLLFCQYGYKQAEHKTLQHLIHRKEKNRHGK